MRKSITLQAGKDDDGRRLDRVIRKAFPQVPVSAIYRSIRTKRLKVNDVACNIAMRLRAGDIIQFEIDDVPLPVPEAGNGNFNPDVLFENDELLVVNKPGGLVTHGTESLATLISRYLEGKLPPSLSFRSGPLHRLDRETSGVIVFSKSLAGASWFSAALRNGLVSKTYLALLCGRVSACCIWDDYMVRNVQQKKTFIAKDGPHSKRALTEIVPLCANTAASLVLAEIATGRPHQIRASAAAHGHPLCGDAKYGGGTGNFHLHAYSLRFPRENPLGLPPLVNAPLPADFVSAILKILP